MIAMNLLANRCEVRRFESLGLVDIYLRDAAGQPVPAKITIGRSMPEGHARARKVTPWRAA